MPQSKDWGIFFVWKLRLKVVLIRFYAFMDTLNIGIIYLLMQLKNSTSITADGVKNRRQGLVRNPVGGFLPRQRLCVNKYIVPIYFLQNSISNFIFAHRNNNPNHCPSE